MSTSPCAARPEFAEIWAKHTTCDSTTDYVELRLPNLDFCLVPRPGHDPGKVVIRALVMPLRRGNGLLSGLVLNARFDVRGGPAS